MNPANHPTRRAVLGSVGLGAVALATPGLVRGDVVKAEEPRLPATIWLREGISEAGKKKIGELSDQIKLVEGGDAAEEAHVVFGGIGGKDLARAKKLRWVQFPAAG